MPRGLQRRGGLCGFKWEMSNELSVALLSPVWTCTVSQTASGHVVRGWPWVLVCSLSPEKIFCLRLSFQDGTLHDCFPFRIREKDIKVSLGTLSLHRIISIFSVNLHDMSLSPNIGDKGRIEYF